MEIARALATKPKLLFLDEPAAGMNTGEGQELIHFLKELHERTGIAIVLIEHHLEIVMELCKDINVLNLGQRIFRWHNGQRRATINPYLNCESVWCNA